MSRRINETNFTLIREGEILTDITSKKWRVGKSLGSGAFGVIYFVSENISKPVDSNVQYVVKIEPHENGPLFVEMHFYLRAAKKETISEWQEEKSINKLGLSPYYSHGSHIYKGEKYRFLILERFGQDLEKLFQKSNRRFDLKSAFSFGIQILDTLEYIHSKGYIHVDIKASNLLLGYQKQYQQKIFLVDFGLACKFRHPDGKHYEFDPDQRKAHDGTLEFTSRDAHIGAHSRRGDLEILGYNLIYWLTGTLPWSDDLSDPEKVHEQKEKFMSNLKTNLKNNGLDSKPFEILHRYFKYVNTLGFDSEPNYDYCRDLLLCGFKNINLKGLIIPKTKGIKRLRDEEPENLLNFKKKKTLRFDSSQPFIQNSNRFLRNSSSSTPVLRSRHFNWEKVLSSHPERDLKIKKVQKTSNTKTVAIPKKDLSPETPIIPTPAMLEIISFKKYSQNKSKSKLDCHCSTPLESPIICRPGYNPVMELVARSLEESKKREEQSQRITRRGRKKKINTIEPQKKVKKTSSRTKIPENNNLQRTEIAYSKKTRHLNNIEKSINHRIYLTSIQETINTRKKLISISPSTPVIPRTTRSRARQMLNKEETETKRKNNSTTFVKFKSSQNHKLPQRGIYKSSFRG